MQVDDIEPSAGRGRGRGGVGVPVLPAGMWESLHGNSNSSGDSAAELDSFLADSASFGEVMPSGFGRGGRGSGRAGGRGGRIPDGRGRGRGIERDLKGKDWECPSCTNINWSWRSTCNKCNGAKPAAVIAAENEIRDGAGRGFNERQDRASAAAVEIDEDGFDDFGRRVKKTRQVDENKKAKELAALNRMAEKYKHLMPTNTTQKPAEADDQSNTGGRFDDAEDSTRDAIVEARENTSHDDTVNNGKEKGKDAENKEKERDRKDREKDKDKDKDRGRDRDRDDDRGRERDRDGGREKGREKDKDRDRDRDDDRDRARERDKDRHKEKDRDRSDRDRDREKDRHRDRERDRDRDRDRDREKDRDRDRERDRDKDNDRSGKRRRSSSR
eukprot:gene28847-37854_t